MSYSTEMVLFLASCKLIKVTHNRKVKKNVYSFTMLRVHFNVAEEIILIPFYDQQCESQITRFNIYNRTNRHPGFKHKLHDKYN